MNKWWGYLHVNGSICAKRFFDDMDLVEATQSNFVDKIMEPFDARDSGEAQQMVAGHFREKEVKVSLSPMDKLISDTNEIAMLSLLDVIREVKKFAEDVEEKLESLVEATGVGETNGEDSKS